MKNSFDTLSLKYYNPLSPKDLYILDILSMVKIPLKLHMITKLIFLHQSVTGIEIFQFKRGHFGLVSKDITNKVHAAAGYIEPDKPWKYKFDSLYSKYYSSFLEKLVKDFTEDEITEIIINMISGFDQGEIINTKGRYTQVKNTFKLDKLWWR